MPARAKAAKSTRARGVRLGKYPGTDMPPSKGAPPAGPPISTTREQRAVAPWPLSDRYPVVLGQSLNLSYVAQVFRLASTGYRMQYVDLLNELVEQDPHLMSVLQKRILSTANGRVDIVAAPLSEDDPEYDDAEELRDFVESEIARIPDLTKALQALLWGLYHGVSCSEIFWTRDSLGWHVERIEFVHSRRLSYPDYQANDLYVWDQGQVYGWTSPWGDTPTNSGIFGTKVASWPGKFIVYAPQLGADYPMREGLGRKAAAWCLFKRIGVRGAIEYLERFAKGFMDVSFRTGNEDSEWEPREATPEDIAIASQIAASIGPGSGSYGAHPDSIEIAPKSFDKGTAKLTWPEWITTCNGELSKLVLGSTLGTEVSTSGGNRALGEVQERAELDLEQYDAQCLGETLKRDLVSWIVRLNRPELQHLTPDIVIHVDKDPDPKSVMEVVKALAALGGEVDQDAVAEQVGVALIPNEHKTADGKPAPRRLYTPDVVDPLVVDPNLQSAEAKQAAQDQLDHDRTVELEKAKNPPQPPPGLGGQASAGASGAPAKPGADAAADGGKPAKKAKGGKGVAQLTDKAALDADAQIDGMIRRLLADRADAAPAQQVYEMLLADYPASALPWILSSQARGPELVPTESIDYSESARWRATKQLADDPAALDKYKADIQAGKQKPVVLVKTPGNPLFEIVDGHHRSLSAKLLGVPVKAYVLTVQVDNGPWVALHGLQKSGSSKSSRSVEPASYYAPDEIDDNA